MIKIKAKIIEYIKKSILKSLQPNPFLLWRSLKLKNSSQTYEEKKDMQIPNIWNERGDITKYSVDIKRIIMGILWTNLCQ